MSTPIVLHLYKANDEIDKTCTRTFVPWKMLKKGVQLYKQLGQKPVEQFEEEDINTLTSYVLAIFDDPDLTIERLDEQADVTEIMTVIRSVVSRANGITDPTLPPPTN